MKTQNLQQLEKAVILQRRLDALGLNLKVGITLSNSELLISRGVITDYKFFSNETVEEMVEAAKEYAKPKYKPLSKICLDSFDTPVYVLEDGKYVEKKLKGFVRDAFMVDDELVKEVYIKEV